MREAGAKLSIGERVAFYRMRRGLTQVLLASLVNRSEDWLSKIERGDREIRRFDVLVELAAALRVSLSDLLGQPVLLEDEQEHDDVPAVRDALMAPGRLSRVLFAEREGDWRPGARQIAGLTESAWEHFQHGRLGRAVALLPHLIRAAQALEDQADRTGWAVSARTHHLTATTMSKIGESDLAWIAAERAMNAADHSDDPLVLASAARAGTHALLAIGRYDEALQLGETARAWLGRRVAPGDGAALSLVGMLDLRMAVAAARRQDRSTANELLRRAEVAASQLGEDANHWQTAFGPTNVRLHQISVALDLGDISFVVDRGPQVDPRALPIERQASHHIDVARAHAYVARDDEAVDLLLGAEQRAPQLVRHNPAVREVVRAIHRRTPASKGERVRLLAERCQAIQ